MFRVFLAKKDQMIIAHNMPFSLPLAIGANIIRLTLQDETKGFKERWRTLFAAVKRQYYWCKPLKTDYLEDVEETEEATDSKERDRIRENQNSPSIYQRIEEILRLIALIIDFIAMTAGVFRVWEWWNLYDLSFFPFDSTLSTICLVNIPKDVPVSYGTECSFVITDWSKVNVPDDYESCQVFEFPISSLLVVTYTAVCGLVLLGLILMRGYFIWTVGCGGAMFLIIISGQQSAYSTDRRCVRFVGKMFDLDTRQIISHTSLIHLWYYRSGFRRLLIQLFTVNG